MAQTEFQYEPFFANKSGAFWKLQSAGWSGALMLRIATALANSQQWKSVFFFFLSTIVGYSISLVLSVAYRQAIHRKPAITWGVSMGAFVVAASFYSYVDAWVYLSFNPDTERSFSQTMLVTFYIDAILLAAWSALYYAINFYVRAEEQQDQMLYLEAQAANAQLAMLRYQLNPHFLFNTLNSISTLVLSKQTEPANAMLSRLSAFLRFSLTSERAGQVTLDKEVEMLKLYLEIEKMRFEDRLRTFYTIDPNVRDALIPSLLLQPLVENAVKYAVSPMEEGADIAVSAQLAGRHVRVIVADTGPGTAGVSDEFTVSTGVGMANIRERLQQAYGDDHLFEAMSRPSGGFEVMIEFPYTKATQDQPAAKERLIPKRDQQQTPREPDIQDGRNFDEGTVTA